MTRCVLRNARMDRLDAFDVEDIAGRRPRELVRAVRRADRDRERIDAGFRDEIRGLLGIGQQLRMIEHAFGAGTVFLARRAGFERAEATELAFDRHADRVRHVDDAARDRHVVFVTRRRLHVFLQRAVHHHAGEAGADRRLAHRRARAVILMQAHRNLRVLFDRREHEMTQERLARIAARAGRCLQDHRAVDFFGGLHDRVDLLHVVDVERGQAVAVFGGVVEELLERDEGHGGSLEKIGVSLLPLRGRRCRQADEGKRGTASQDCPHPSPLPQLAGEGEELRYATAYRSGARHPRRAPA